MIETHGRVKAPGSRTRPGGAHRPDGSRPRSAQPHRRATGPASRGATAGPARQDGRPETASQVPAAAPATGGSATEHGKGRSQRLLVFALLAAIIVVDQAVKWWAWRHVPGVMINPGGDYLSGATVGGWYADPVTGALLDVVDFGLVGLAIAALARRRRPAAVMVTGCLMVGGWASNLLDRLAMHYWTAPGSIRGAVDFIPVAGRRWNLADILIIGATPLFLLATARLAKRAANRRAAAPTRRARRQLPRVPIPAFAVAGAALIMTVALGATHDGSLTKPAHARRPRLPACAQAARPKGAVSYRGCLIRASWTADRTAISAVSM